MYVRQKSITDVWWLKRLHLLWSGKTILTFKQSKKQFIISTNRIFSIVSRALPFLKAPPTDSLKTYMKRTLPKGHVTQYFTCAARSTCIWRNSLNKCIACVHIWSFAIDLRFILTSWYQPNKFLKDVSIKSAAHCTAEKSNYESMHNI